MKSTLIKSSLFLVIFALFSTQVEPAAAQIIVDDDPPALLTDVTCILTASTDYAGRNKIPSGYTGFVDHLWIHFEVKNNGPAGTTQLFNISRDIILNGGSVDPYGPSLLVPKLLSPGETYKYTPVYVDLGAPLTSLHAYLDVDTQNDIPETREWNNSCEFNYSYFGLLP